MVAAAIQLGDNAMKNKKMMKRDDKNLITINNIF